MTIFTVVNAVLLEPLPNPQADRIVTVTHQAPGLQLPSAELLISPGLVDPDKAVVRWVFSASNRTAMLRWGCNRFSQNYR